MGLAQFCVLSGACFRETVGELCCWYVPTAAPRAVTFMDGSGIAIRDGQIMSGELIGDVERALDCATPPKAATCALAGYSALSETCRAQSHGFLTCSHPYMLQRILSRRISEPLQILVRRS